MPARLEMFDPVRFSIEENDFLLSHLGEPPITAFKSVPSAVNARAVEPVIDQVYQMIQAEKHSGDAWCGVESVKTAIRAYLDQANQWLRDRKRGAPRFPSMYTFDSRGRATKGAVGSDSGTVKSFFTDDGVRKPFAINLFPKETLAWQPNWSKADQPKPEDGVAIDDTLNRVECLVCHHTESFKPESKASLAAAKGRIRKHLRTATDEPERHREALNRAFQA